MALNHLKRLLLGSSLLAAFYLPVTHARLSDFYCSSPENQCTFVALNGKNNKLFVSNKLRAKQRISPFSTFKIPNSLIAIDLGLVKDTTTPLSYDPNKYPAKTWWPKSWLKTEHSLKKAFKSSVVPIYQTLAVKIGEENMQEKLNGFNYGNKDISSGIDNFWLDKSIKISAIEQIEFLQKLHKRQFNIKTSSYDQLETIMLAEKNSHYAMYAKTGGGQIQPSIAQGWYVGYVIYKDTPYYFAFNMTGNTFKEIQPKRKAFAKEALVHIGALPTSALNKNS